MTAIINLVLCFVIFSICFVGMMIVIAGGILSAFQSSSLFHWWSKLGLALYFFAVLIVGYILKDKLDLNDIENALGFVFMAYFGGVGLVTIIGVPIVMAIKKRKEKTTNGTPC